MFKKIIVPVDGSSLAEQAIGSAASIARECGAEVELLLVHTGVTGRERDFAAIEREEHIYVQGLAFEVARRFGLTVTCHLSRGLPVDAIVEHAREVKADLVVMTSHGRTGFSRLWLGSVADGVVRESPIPVLIERPIEGRKWRANCSVAFHRVLIPLDGSELAAAMLHPAIDLCRWLEARPILGRVILPVTVAFTEAGVPVPAQIIDPDATRHYVNEAQDQLTRIALELESNGRMRAETDVAVGDNVAATIIAMAHRRRADLIAMSTHSRGASRLILGSVTDKVLRGTNLPLLLLHPTEGALVLDDPMVLAAAEG